jgi:hypothetical protein
MDKNKEQSELESFMGDLGSKGQADPLEDKGEDPFGHLEEKSEETEEVVAEEKPLPFNKDPKVQKFIEKEISKRMAEFTPAESKQEQKKENDEVVDALTAVIGNDTPEKRRAIQALQDRLDEGARKITEWEQREQQAEIADREAEEELATAFDNIEENFGVDITSNVPLAKKTRAEFVSFVEKIAPKDRNGDIVDYPDMNSAWETFSTLRKSTAQPNRAKELASRSMARSVETSSEPNIPRSKTPFASSDEFIASLSKQ